MAKEQKRKGLYYTVTTVSDHVISEGYLLKQDAEQWRNEMVNERTRVLSKKRSITNKFDEFEIYCDLLDASEVRQAERMYNASVITREY